MNVLRVALILLVLFLGFMGVAWLLGLLAPEALMDWVVTGGSAILALAATGMVMRWLVKRSAPEKS